MKYLISCTKERNTGTWKALAKYMTLVAVGPQVDQHVTEQRTDLRTGDLHDAQGHPSFTISPSISTPQGQPQPEPSIEQFALQLGWFPVAPMNRPYPPGTLDQASPCSFYLAAEKGPTPPKQLRLSSFGDSCFVDPQTIHSLPTQQNYFYMGNDVHAISVPPHIYCEETKVSTQSWPSTQTGFPTRPHTEQRGLVASQGDLKSTQSWPSTQTAFSTRRNDCPSMTWGQDIRQSFIEPSITPHMEQLRLVGPQGDSKSTQSRPSTQTDFSTRRNDCPSTTWGQDIRQSFIEPSITTPHMQQRRLVGPQGALESAPLSVEASKPREDWAHPRPNLRGYTASGLPCFDNDGLTPKWSVADMKLPNIRIPKDPGLLKDYMMGLYRLLPVVAWQVRTGHSKEKLEATCQGTTLRKLSVIRRHLRSIFTPQFRRCVQIVVQHLDPEVRYLARRVVVDAFPSPDDVTLWHKDTPTSADHDPHNDNEASQCNGHPFFNCENGSLLRNVLNGFEPRLGSFSRFAARCLIMLGGFWTPILTKVPEYVERAAVSLWPAGAYETQCLHEALDLIAQRDEKIPLGRLYSYRMPTSYLEAEPWFLLLAMHAPKVPGEQLEPPNVQMIHLLAWIDNLWKVMKYVDSGKRGTLPLFPGFEAPTSTKRSTRRVMEDDEMDTIIADLEAFYSKHMKSPDVDSMTYKLRVLKDIRDTQYTKRKRGPVSYILQKPEVRDPAFSAWWKFREQLPSILSVDNRGFIALLVHHLDKKRGVNEYSRYLGDFLAQVLTWWNLRNFSRSFDLFPQLASPNLNSSVAFKDRILMAQHFLQKFCEKYGITEALLEVSEQECNTLSDQFLEADIEFFKFLDCDARLGSPVGTRRGILQRCLAYATAIYEKRNALNAVKFARVSEAEGVSSDQVLETDLAPLQ
eukprot:Blabericola_migrator_1__1447@NODE_1380_length_4676_cov_22_551313_g925_i0_p1_GENE_NODE_1380_length_4676_cov_22_551313_g925_i0NODE_1380_length_4676_cov_22_551313_g925_i0_p1_ORF_typecomplete_len913_score65_21_NODE_1380_length_4676_cov_22_551313_g925_i05943332